MLSQQPCLLLRMLPRQACLMACSQTPLRMLPRQPCLMACSKNSWTLLRMLPRQACRMACNQTRRTLLRMLPCQPCHLLRPVSLNLTLRQPCWNAHIRMRLPSSSMACVLAQANLLRMLPRQSHWSCPVRTRLHCWTSTPKAAAWHSWSGEGWPCLRVDMATDGCKASGKWERSVGRSGSMARLELASTY